MTKTEIAAEIARIEKAMDENNRRLVEAERMDWHIDRAYRLRQRIRLAEQMQRITKNA